MGRCALQRPIVTLLSSGGQSNAMISFLVRRLLLLIPVLFGILIITFALARLIPGDPCYDRAG